MKQIESSFRDPSGSVFSDGQEIVRTINSNYAEHWNAVATQDFLKKCVASGRMISFKEREPLGNSWKSLSVEKIPFISYPFEWSFSQLQDAAMLTLRLNKLALRSGLVMKDASAYNVQFIGKRPVFIDLLSFETRTDDEPWIAYRQFCMHFLAPLALMSRVDLQCGLLSKLWVGGIPLEFAGKLLPKRSWINPGLLFHLHLHARFEKRHGVSKKSGTKAKNVKCSSSALLGIMDNLIDTIQKLQPHGAETEWADYYNDTNYNSTATEFKMEYIKKAASEGFGKTLAVDLGANTGRYSKILADFYDTVLALDIDSLAVERHYQILRNDRPQNILPLVMDLGNSSPSFGWALRERDSFTKRCQADLLTALALVHHLVITAEIPLRQIARYFAELLNEGGRLVLEFVPKEDSQTQRLLAVRKDIYADYHLDGMRSAFGEFFEEMAMTNIPDSLRTIHIFRRSFLPVEA